MTRNLFSLHQLIVFSNKFVWIDIEITCTIIQATITKICTYCFSITISIRGRVAPTNFEVKMR